MSLIRYVWYYTYNKERTKVEKITTITTTNLDHVLTIL